MNIQLDQDAMKSLVSEAIMQSLDENKRNALIKGAIEHLLTPESTTYGKPVSPIESAFNKAVELVAHKIASEMMQADAAFKSKVQELIAEAVVLLMETNREKTVKNLAESIASGMAYRETRY